MPKPIPIPKPKAFSLFDDDDDVVVPVPPPPPLKAKPKSKAKVVDLLSHVLEEPAKPLPPAPSGLAGLVKKQLDNPTVLTAPNVILVARAGTGKTTSMVEGLKEMLGLPVSITPSPQQRALWDEIAKSKGAKYITLVAYNKSIANELKTKVPAPVQAMTTHGMGFRTLNRSFACLKHDNAVNDGRTTDILATLLHSTPQQLRKDKGNLVSLVKKFTELCKAGLVDGTEHDLADIAQHYSLEWDDERPQIVQLIPDILDHCLNRVEEHGYIDYDDMVWLPVKLKLPVFKSDLLLVDESQDLNKARQALVKMAGRRIILVGDPKQAIYGFSGADTKSMDRMFDDLSKTRAGCIRLPLTVTRRCGKAIVKEAQRLVPDFEAHESNPEGTIERAYLEPYYNQPSYRDSVQDGDMILCRSNAPLVGQCLKFLKGNRRAFIQGKKDVAESLISLIRKLEKKSTKGMTGYSIADLKADIGTWMATEWAKENEKKNPSDSRLEAIIDKANCITSIAEGMPTVDAMVAKLESMFTDEKQPKGISLSSIHRAKGLEASTVWYLKVGFSKPPKSNWEAEQEANLEYVAITRAIDKLVYVTDPSSKR